MKKFSHLTYPLFLLFLLLLSGCDAVSPAALHGRILLWHSWSAEDTPFLEESLDRFEELNPGMIIISSRIPPEELKGRYMDAARLGVGPDVFIGPNQWLPELAAAPSPLIRDISPHEPSTEIYLSTAVDTLRFLDGLYGIPLSLRPVAMYYNTDLVETPAATLEAWLAQAEAGQSVALNTQFYEAYWGIQTFGGDVFDEDGQVILDRGGFANWLSWLQTAQDSSGMFLSRDTATLRSLYLEERVAYYVGGPDELATAVETLGREKVGVTVLPAGPNGPSGPLLMLEALMFNSASSDNQVAIALRLAQYLTNASQSASFMRDTKRAPANRTVRIDPRIHPHAAGFAAQARTAVSAPNSPQWQRIQELGDVAYQSVLGGVVEANEAAVEITTAVNEEFRSTAAAIVDDFTCGEGGVIRLWHGWEGADADVLALILDGYAVACPGVTVEMETYAPDNLRDLLLSSSTELPDLVIGSSRWVLPLAEADIIRPIDADVPTNILQRYVPAAQNTLLYNNGLYGLPIAAELQAMYYNTDLVEDPIQTLDELIQQTSMEQSTALPTQFKDAYWGAPAFGAVLFDEEGRLALVDTGFIDWLTWMQTAAEAPGFMLAADPALLREVIRDEDVAHYVGPVSLLEESEAGPERLQLFVLPDGPVAEAAPWLETEAFLFPRGGDEARLERAERFAVFATQVENQALLMREARRAPVNVNVNTNGDQAMTGFLRQLTTAFVPPNVPALTAVLELGDEVYLEVLSGEKDPVTAACEFKTAVDQANGFPVTESDLPPVCLQEEEGE